MITHPELVLRSAFNTALHVIWIATKVIVVILTLIILGALSNLIAKDMEAVQGTIERIDMLAEEGPVQFVALKFQGYEPLIHVYYDAEMTEIKPQEGLHITIIFGERDKSQLIKGESLNFRSIAKITKFDNIEQANTCSRAPQKRLELYFCYI